MLMRQSKETHRTVPCVKNSQPNATWKGDHEISKALSSEMLNIANRQVDGSLSGRTVDGVARELRQHNYAYIVTHPVVKVFENSDIGGMDPNMGDYDYNAKGFENPIAWREVIPEWLDGKITAVAKKVFNLS